MRISIRWRGIFVLNTVVFVLAAVFGYIAQDVAGRIVEERFAKEMVASASGFLRGRHFPRSDTTMAYLRQMFNAEWVASENQASNVVASSLTPEQTDEFRHQVGQLGRSGWVTLAGMRYRVDSADVSADDSQTGQTTAGRLYMLVPETQFQAARAEARSRVLAIILPAAGVATLFASLFSITVTRPIRRLVKQMDAVNEGEPTAPPPRPLIRGPSEIVALSDSFQRLLERLNAARTRMVQSGQLATLGRVSLSVAHELRNPLSGIKMNIRVLRDHPSLADDPGVEAILREIDRMELYLEELMSLSPGQDVERELDLAPAKLSDVVESVLTIFAGRCRHAGVEVARDVPNDEPEVPVDAGLLRQAIMNLVVNAIEAMPGGGTLRVAVRCDEDTVRCEIADSGDGVADGGVNLFDAFTTSKPNGVGLGLYLCKQIAERHGGSIGYDSTPNGATFWIDLPRRGGGDEGVVS